MESINRERRERRRVEEEKRTSKIEKSRELSKRWELIRLCVSFLKEHGGEWDKRQANEDEKKREKENILEKKIRFEKIEKKRDTARKKSIQQEITSKLILLGENGESSMAVREKRERMRELKEVKENLWKKYGKERMVITVRKEPEENELNLVLVNIRNIEDEIDKKKLERENERIFKKELQKIKAKRKKK